METQVSLESTGGGTSSDRNVNSAPAKPIVYQDTFALHIGQRANPSTELNLATLPDSEMRKALQSMGR